MAEDPNFEDDQLSSMTTDDVIRASRLLDNEIRILKVSKPNPPKLGFPSYSDELQRTNLELESFKEKIKENQEKIKLNKQLPYLVGNIVELCTLGLRSDKKPLKVYLVMSLVYIDLFAYICNSQIQELVEAIVLPMTHKDRFQKLGIRPPKGVLLYGPPGTGKTLMARACAAQTNATFLKLAGPQLVQMFIGDGAKLVRDAFQLAKEKSPCIIFIDEIDAIGTKRFDSEVSGDREVQRTMLELLNQLDGFSSDERIKVGVLI
ncbi:hypothetical protein BHE74_00047009 [Ensete ventricosum]|nr:hypothetical protein BHE74_00047009 [Ensete ventricosum]